MAALSQLEISNFRNLLSVNISPIPSGFNFLCGKNGSGKTSLLESIYYISLGRSFRSSVLGRVINNTAESLAVFAKIKSSLDNLESAVGFERKADGASKARINGHNVTSSSETADILPVQLIDSYCHQLLDSGPAIRRKFMDWGSFYDNASFIRNWKQFGRALKQRNILLKSRASISEINPWSKELVSSSTQVDAIRQQYIAKLTPLLNEIIGNLVDIPGLEISYYSGWNNSLHYEDVLADSLDRDRLLGHTHFGPQKADLVIKINGVPAKDILSRGQQKLFVCAMIVARGSLLQSGTKRSSVYLVDDLPAELDIQSQTRLLDLLQKQNAQVFVTAINLDSIKPLLTSLNSKIFHVEHGVVDECK